MGTGKATPEDREAGHHVLNLQALLLNQRPQSLVKSSQQQSQLDISSVHKYSTPITILTARQQLRAPSQLTTAKGTTASNLHAVASNLGCASHSDTKGLSPAKRLPLEIPMILLLVKIAL